MSRKSRRTTNKVTYNKRKKKKWEMIFSNIKCDDCKNIVGYWGTFCGDCRKSICHTCSYLFEKMDYNYICKNCLHKKNKL